MDPLPIIHEEKVKESTPFMPIIKIKGKIKGKVMVAEFSTTRPEGEPLVLSGIMNKVEKLKDIDNKTSRRF